MAAKLKLNMQRAVWVAFATLLAGCATGSVTKTPKVVEKPVFFVEDPVDLLPNLQAAVHLNVRRIREHRDIFDRLVARAVEGADSDSAAQSLKIAAEATETVLVGAARRPDGEPDLMLVVRTQGHKVIDDAGKNLFGTETTEGDFGFLWGHVGEDDLVVVDDYTVVVFQAGLRTRIEALLRRGPARRFKDEPVFRALAQDVAFGSAPVSMLGVLPPQVLDQMAPHLGPALGPLVGALRSVQSYGGQVDLSDALALRLLAKGRGSMQIGLLAGAILMMKSAVAGGGKDPMLVELAQNLRVETRGGVLELSYSIARAEVLKLIEQYVKAPESSPAETPKGSEI